MALGTEPSAGNVNNTPFTSSTCKAFEVVNW